MLILYSYFGTIPETKIISPKDIISWRLNKFDEEGDDYEFKTVFGTFIKILPDEFGIYQAQEYASEHLVGYDDPEYINFNVDMSIIKSLCQT